MLLFVPRLCATIASSRAQLYTHTRSFSLSTRVTVGSHECDHSYSTAVVSQCKGDNMYWYCRAPDVVQQSSHAAVQYEYKFSIALRARHVCWRARERDFCDKTRWNVVDMQECCSTWPLVRNARPFSRRRLGVKPFRRATLGESFLFFRHSS